MIIQHFDVQQQKLNWTMLERNFMLIVSSTDIDKVEIQIPSNEIRAWKIENSDPERIVLLHNRIDDHYNNW